MPKIVFFITKNFV